MARADGDVEVGGRKTEHPRRGSRKDTKAKRLNPAAMTTSHLSISGLAGTVARLWQAHLDLEPKSEEPMVDEARERQIEIFERLDPLWDLARMLEPRDLDEAAILAIRLANDFDLYQSPFAAKPERDCREKKLARITQRLLDAIAVALVSRSKVPQPIQHAYFSDIRFRKIREESALDAATARGVTIASILLEVRDLSALWEEVDGSSLDERLETIDEIVERLGALTTAARVVMPASLDDIAFLTLLACDELDTYRHNHTGGCHDAEGRIMKQVSESLATFLLERTHLPQRVVQYYGRALTSWPHRAAKIRAEISASTTG